MDTPDPSKKYIVMLKTPLDETRGAEAALRLAEKLNISIAKMTRLLTGQPGPLTKAVSEKTAQKLEQLFRRLNVDVALEPLADTVIVPLVKEPAAPSYSAEGVKDQPLAADTPRIALESESVFKVAEPPETGSLPEVAYTPGFQDKTERRPTLRLPLAVLLVLIVAGATVLGASYFLPQSSLGGLLGAFSPTTPDTPIDTLVGSENLTTDSADSPEAKYDLAWRYANGIDIKQDYTAAAALLIEAAEADYPEAQYLLGLYYLYGHGLEADPSEAELWLRRAAEANLAEAQFELGRLYLEGSAVPANPDEAQKWLRLANEQGIEASADFITDSPVGNEDPLIEALEDAKLSADNADTATDVLTDAAAAEPSETITVTEPSEVAEPETSSLFTAVIEGETGLISQLLAAGANINTRDAYGQTPLMYAAGQSAASVVLALVNEGADVNAQSDAGWTALMYAARDNPEVVAPLLENGANPDLISGDGQTAFELALEHHPNVAPLLSERVDSN